MRIKSLRKIRFLLPLLGLCSCGPTQLDRPLVVASFYPVWFLVDAIGGDTIDVENLTPAGTFFLFAFMCLPYLYIMWRHIPETTGKTLEEIENYWRK